ncbi:MAG: GGDEF domain-containing protein [Deltaproteobacteria bacterium]|nr:GGDEF domain-containing protein [Deltaproteobacteria bacterium]
MVVSLHSEPPSLRPSPEDSGSQARAESRRFVIPFRASLLPTGSPFGWNARDRSLYVQFLSVLLMVIVTFSFAVLDGWPFLLEPPADPAALRTTTMLAEGALVFWFGFYIWTWRWYLRKGTKFSWLLFSTIAAHIVTGTAVCYAIGPYTAASGLIMVAALLLGMVLLERRSFWIAVIGWFLSMFAMHFASKAGALPFHSLFEASLDQSDLAKVAAERAVAAALIYIPLAVVMDHLISVWRQDERSFYEAAQFDSLTGAYTRGFAMAVMQRALLKARGDAKPLGVLMLDLDHFKRINDAHGHARGDLVLENTTFVILLPGADLEQAMGAAERCRAAVAKMEIPEAPYLSVTASVGVAAFPNHGEDLDRLLKASDRAMYAAKGNGRNRIETANV